MPHFEKKVNYEIDFENPIFIAYKPDTIMSASARIFKNSTLTFNFIVKNDRKIEVVYLYFIISPEDIEKFKGLTVSDTKNIIYNKLSNTSAFYQPL